MKANKQTFNIILISSVCSLFATLLCLLFFNGFNQPSNHNKNLNYVSDGGPLEITASVLDFKAGKRSEIKIVKEKGAYRWKTNNNYLLHMLQIEEKKLFGHETRRIFLINPEGHGLVIMTEDAGGVKTDVISPNLYEYKFAKNGDVVVSKAYAKSIYK